MSDDEKLIEKLAKIELFADFATDTPDNKEFLTKIYGALTLREFKAGDDIITEGKMGDSLFILTRGDVRILRATLTNDKFAVVNLSADMNIFFGEVALIDSDRRSATVLALTDCTTLEMSRETYLKLCELHPYIGYKVTLRIAQRISASLRKVNNDVTTLYQALVEEVEGSQ